jgi:hypothetical protein
MTMPVHVEQLNTEVSAQGGEMPWSRDQIELLVKLVLERLEQKERSERAGSDQTRLRPSVLPRQPDA